MATIASPSDDAGDSTWESHGSETEVISEQVVDKRQKVQLVLQRRLKDFGSPVNFSDFNATESKHTSADFAPYEDKAFNIHVVQLNKGTQIFRSYREISCQTDVPPTKNAWIQYEPREFATEECNQIMQSESFTEFVKSVVSKLDDALEEAEIVDVFTDDFEVFKNFSNDLDGQ